MNTVVPPHHQGVPETHQQPPQPQPEAQKPAPQTKTKPSKPEIIVPDIIHDRILENKTGRSKRYRVGKFLGKGGFAKCYALTSLDTNNEYAGKIMSRETMKTNENRQKLHNEINIHRSLVHPNIVRFERFFIDENNIILLLELCSPLSLWDLLKHRKHLTETETQFYVWQLIEATMYLHENLVIHRDLKLGNILLDNNLNLKVADFGLAAKLTAVDERKKTLCGTPNYIAPEILTDSSGKGHSFSVDIWTIGVITYTLLFGKPPFETSELKTTYQRIKDVVYTFPPQIYVTPAAQDFIRCILITDPDTRPTLAQLRMHEFFTQSPFPKELPPECAKGPISFIHWQHPNSPRAPPPFVAQEVAPYMTQKELVLSQSTLPSKPTSENISKPSQHSFNQLTSQTGIPSHAVSDVGTNITTTRSTQTLQSVNHQPSHAQKHAPSSLQSQQPKHQSHPQSSDPISHKQPTPTQGMSNRIPTTSFTPQKPIPQTKTPQPRTSITSALPRTSLHQSTDIPATKSVHHRSSQSHHPQPVQPVQQQPDQMKQHPEYVVDRQTKELVPRENILEYIRSITAAGKTADFPMIEVPLPKHPPIWVNLWIDYTNRYGVGYLLSDGSMGVLFNDCTKMLLHSNGKNAQYIYAPSDVEGGLPDHDDVTISNKYSLKEFIFDPSQQPTYPNIFVEGSALRHEFIKKARILRYFLSYLIDYNSTNARVPGDEDTPYTPGEIPVYVRAFDSTKAASVFRLSNRTTQIIFTDLTELLISASTGVVAYTDSSQTKSVYDLEEATLQRARMDIVKRLRYASQLIYDYSKPQS